MANTDPSTAPAIETLSALTPATLAMLETLVIQSGWNQSAQDWGVFARHGSVHVIRDPQGVIVASGATLPMERRGAGNGSPIAWISMILVTPAARGQGMGRAMFAHCLREVQDMGRVPMLDATPQGEKLYTQFGFEPLWRLTRYLRPAQAASATGKRFDKPSLETLVELDGQALGFKRAHLLGELCGRDDSWCVRSELGFAIVRSGRVAHQIGPLLAMSEEAATALVLDAARALDGPILIDVPDERPQLRQALTDAGFQPQRSFARMALTLPDQSVPSGQTAFIHAIAGPEFG